MDCSGTIMIGMIKIDGSKDGHAVIFNSYTEKNGIMVLPI